MVENNYDDESLLVLENSLKKKLYPVKPDNKFVGTLHDRLEGSPHYLDHQRTAAKLLTIAAGLVMGLAIFLIGRGFIKAGKNA